MGRVDIRRGSAKPSTSIGRDGLVVGSWRDVALRGGASREELVEAAAELDPDAVGSFELMTPRALAGSLEACQAFVRSLRLFVDEVSEATDPHGALKEAGYHETLLLRGLSAPLTGWVGSFGFGRGVVASVAAS